ncbi:MAG TPA: PQQ-binding-like beta-propeller repeat protein [Rhizomicrobium sp.]|nr:PQQ-binding-like beta-propeller repeat protein [Rhizomicrobium sp.]
MKSRFCTTAALAGVCLMAAQAVPGLAVARVPGKQSEFAVAYQINPAHSGGIDFSAGFATPLTKLWSTTVSSSLLSYPVVANGRVFLNDGSVTYALDLGTGATKWSKNTGTSIGPAYDNGLIFLVTQGGMVSALSEKSGKTLWSTQVTDQYFFTSAPMAVKGQVFVGGAGVGGDVYAFDEVSGALKWEQEVENGDDSSPAFGDNGIYVSYPQQYYKFDPVTGNLDWHFSGDGEGGGGNTPVYYSKRAYIQDWTSGNSILDAKTGNVVGTFGANNGDPPAFWQLADGRKLGFSLYNGTLYGWKVSSQVNVWSFAGDGGLSTAPIVVNGLVIEGSGSGEVYALDAGSGTQEWSDKTAGGVTALAAGQGTLIVVSGGVVTAYVPQ